MIQKIDSSKFVNNRLHLNETVQCNLLQLQPSISIGDESSNVAYDSDQSGQIGFQNQLNPTCDQRQGEEKKKKTPSLYAVET